MTRGTLFGEQSEVLGADQVAKRKSWEELSWDGCRKVSWKDTQLKRWFY